MIAGSMRCFSRAMAFAVALAAAAMPAAAHKASDSYLQLREQVQGQGIELRWDIALRDLDSVIEIDADGDSKITWGEIKTAWPGIETHAIQRITLDGCTFKPERRGLEQRSDGAYAVLWLHAECALPAEPAVSYSLFRETDPTHRGLLKIERDGQPVKLVVLDPRSGEAVGGSTGRTVEAASSGAQNPAAWQLPSFLQEGVHHIVTGYDHVLFLLCLLLPAVMRRTPQGWRPVDRLSQAVLPVAGIVTAFTLAHSITLTLAALKLASLPAWFIEPAIAITIVLAAVDNLRPIFRIPRYAVAFIFGLLHGFGFAGVLAEMDLPAASFAWALFQFNLGLELGQLGIVFVVVGAMFLLRHRPGYPRWVIQGGSVAAMTIGALWFIERTADVALLPL